MEIVQDFLDIQYILPLPEQFVVKPVIAKLLFDKNKPCYSILRSSVIGFICWYSCLWHQDFKSG